MNNAEASKIARRLAVQSVRTMTTPALITTDETVRIALLTDMNDAADRSLDKAQSPTFLSLPLLEYHLILAAKHGCEKILYLSAGESSTQDSAEKRARRLGLEFATVKTARDLSLKVAAQDELLLIAPDLLPDERRLQSLLDHGPVVLTLPAALSAQEGFERIDRDECWAGIMMVPGSVVGKLADLPPDVDLISALLRASLQSCIPTTSLGAEALADGTWHLNPSPPQRAFREQAWFADRRHDIPFTAPGLATAERVGLRLARDIAATRAAALPGLFALVAVIGALIFVAIDSPTIGFALATLAAVSVHVSSVISRLEEALTSLRQDGLSHRFAGWVIDLVLVLLLITTAPQSHALLEIFIPLMLFGVLYLGAEHGSRRWQYTYRDRVTLGCILSIAAFAGVALETAAVLALLALGTRFFRAARAS